MGNIRKSPIIAFVIVFVALYAVIYILPKVAGVMQSSYTAEYGELKIHDRTEGYFVRTEYVYFSTKTGDENRYIKENKLVRKGTRIMELVTGGDDDADTEGSSNSSGSADQSGSGNASGAGDGSQSKGNASGAGDGSQSKGNASGTGGTKSANDASSGADQSGVGELSSENDQSGTGGAGSSNSSSSSSSSTKSSKPGSATYDRFRKNIKGDQRIDTEDFITLQEGIVAYHTDGMESLLTPENMNKKDKNFYALLTNSDDINLARKRVQATDPVFKICDRSRWYIVCYVPKASADRYKIGDKVTVSINKEKKIDGKVFDISSERREKRLIIKTDYYYKDFATTRVAEVEVITSDVMGLIISNTSIVEKDGSKGVYVRQKTGDYKFTRISVIATDGEKSAIRPTQFRDSKGKPVQSVRSYDDVLRRPSAKQRGDAKK